jgi:hypothetical protein
MAASAVDRLIWRKGDEFAPKLPRRAQLRAHDLCGARWQRIEHARVGETQADVRELGLAHRRADLA